MARGTLGVVVGLAVWISVVTVAGLVMRETWPAYASLDEELRASWIRQASELPGWVPSHGPDEARRQEQLQEGGEDVGAIRNPR